MQQIESQIQTNFAIWCVRLGLAACLTFARATTAQPYAVTDLGTLGGTNGMAYGINDQEQIVGTAQTGFGNYRLHV